MVIIVCLEKKYYTGHTLMNKKCKSFIKPFYYIHIIYPPPTHTHTIRNRSFFLFYGVDRAPSNIQRLPIQTAFAFEFSIQRVHLDIQVGEHTNNYAEIAAKDKLTELQLRVRQLMEQVDQVQKEQNYQRVSAL